MDSKRGLDIDLVCQDCPEDKPITKQTIIDLLKFNTKKGYISHNFATKRIKELGGDYNPVDYEARRQKVLNTPLP